MSAKDKRSLFLAGLLCLTVSPLLGNVLIGIDNLDGTNHGGWEVYDYNGQLQSGSRVTGETSSVRYLTGFSVRHGSGDFQEVTALYCRDTLSNQDQYLRTYKIDDGEMVSSQTFHSSSFEVSNIWKFKDGTWMADENQVPVWGQATTKKPGYSDYNRAGGNLVDGDDEGAGSSYDYGPYYENTSSRDYQGMAFDPDASLAYVSTTDPGDGGRDSIEIYSVEDGDTWTSLGNADVPEEWTPLTDITAMSIGPDYNGDGDADLYVAVSNPQTSLNEGKSFWTVLDVEGDSDSGFSLNQVAENFTVELDDGEMISGIAVDKSIAVPEPLSALIMGVGAARFARRRRMK